MPSIEYETIFNKFLGKVTDYAIASMDDESSNEIMTEYLLSALALPEVENLFTELTVDEDMQEISFDLKRSKGESADTRFVTEIVLIAMQIAWLEPQVYSHQVTIQILGGKEEKLRAYALTARCIWKHCSVSSHICWDILRDISLKRKNEISLNVNVLKEYVLDNQQGSNEELHPQRLLVEIPLGQASEKRGS